jgi:hypothetical protein
VDRRYRAEDRAAKAASATASAEPAPAEAPEVAEMIH